MPQGKLKTKVKVPDAAKKKHTQKQIRGPRKGGRVIKPKKTKIIQTKKLQKDLSASINKRIESEVILLARKNTSLSIIRGSNSKEAPASSTKK